MPVEVPLDPEDPLLLPKLLEPKVDVEPVLLAPVAEPDPKLEAEPEPKPEALVEDGPPPSRLALAFNCSMRGS